MIARIRKSMEEKEGGFTLIELLVVIIIIGILAAIAIPVFLSQRQKGYNAQAQSDVRNLASLEEGHLTDNPTYADATALVAAKAQLSVGDTVKIYINGNTDFCLIGHNTNSASTANFVYDSGAGGMQTKEAAGVTAASCISSDLTTNTSGTSLTNTTGSTVVG